MTPATLTADAFAALVAEHQCAVFRTLTRLTGPGPHVEDLAQEAFLRLFRALPGFRGDAAISTYLYRIVLNLAQDEWKRRRRERGFIASSPLPPGEDDAPDPLENVAAEPWAGLHTATPEALFATAELATAVSRELLALPAVERAALVLFHQEECTYQQVAAVLDLPLNTVRTHLHRGRERLRQRLQLPQAASPRPATLNVPLHPISKGAARQ